MKTCCCSCSITGCVREASGQKAAVLREDVAGSAGKVGAEPGADRSAQGHRGATAHLRLLTPLGFHVLNTNAHEMAQKRRAVACKRDG